MIGRKKNYRINPVAWNDEIMKLRLFNLLSFLLSFSLYGPNMASRNLGKCHTSLLSSKVYKFIDSARHKAYVLYYCVFVRRSSSVRYEWKHKGTFAVTRRTISKNIPDTWSRRLKESWTQHCESLDRFHVSALARYLEKSRKATQTLRKLQDQTRISEGFVR